MFYSKMLCCCSMELQLPWYSGCRMVETQENQSLPQQQLVVATVTCTQLIFMHKKSLIAAARSCLFISIHYKQPVLTWIEGRDHDLRLSGLPRGNSEGLQGRETKPIYPQTMDNHKKAESFHSFSRFLSYVQTNFGVKINFDLKI